MTFAFLIIFGVLAYNFKYFEHFYFCLGMSSDENNSLAEEEEVGHERKRTRKKKITAEFISAVINDNGKKEPLAAHLILSPVFDMLKVFKFYMFKLYESLLLGQT